MTLYIICWILLIAGSSFLFYRIYSFNKKIKAIRRSFKLKEAILIEEEKDNQRYYQEKHREFKENFQKMYEELETTNKIVELYKDEIIKGHLEDQNTLELADKIFNTLHKR